MPERAQQPPEAEPAVSVGTAGRASTATCAVVRGSCREPGGALTLDETGVGQVRGVGTRFFSLTVQQPDGTVLDDGRRSVALTLTSPSGANYDLRVYRASSCALVAAGSGATGADTAVYQPDAVDLGSSYELVAEVRFLTGTCDPEAPFTLVAQRR